MKLAAAKPDKKQLKGTAVTRTAASTLAKARLLSRSVRSATPARIVEIAPHEHSRSREEYTPGMLVVKCKEDVVANVPDIRAARIASVRTFALPKAVEDPFKNLANRQLLKEIIPVFSRTTRGRSLSIAPTSAAASFAMSVRDSENEDLRGINMLRLSRSVDLNQVEKELANTPGIEYVHRVPRRWMTARPLPKDPLASQQWSLKAVGWLNPDPLPNATSIKVGVLDTGVDITHPELQNMVKSYIHDGAASTDIVGHGTHVSGIITAEMNNNVGITGICQCDLTVWKIFTDTPDPSDGEYYVDDIMYQRALNAARNSGMQVVNLSIGGSGHSQTEEFLFRRLIDAGVTVVSAMGNEFNQGNPIEYPAAYNRVVAVGATGRTNRRASFSNTGSHISIVAPGMNIISTLPMTPSAARKANETKYASWSGTSMATPHVTATAALVVAHHAGLTPQQVTDRLTSTATKLHAMGNENKTNEYGFGLLNVERAVS